MKNSFEFASQICIFKDQKNLLNEMEQVEPYLIAPGQKNGIKQVFSDINCLTIVHLNL